MNLFRGTRKALKKLAFSPGSTRSNHGRDMYETARSIRSETGKEGGAEKYCIYRGLQELQKINSYCSEKLHSSSSTKEH
jgi:hypothetical protein